MERRQNSGEAYKFSGSQEHFFFMLPDPDSGSFEGLALEKGVIFAFNDIHTEVWPAGLPETDGGGEGAEFLMLNICLSGRCETALPEGKIAIVSAGDLALGTQQAQRDFYYPTACYQGIELFADLRAASGGGYFELSGIDFSALCEKLRCREALYFRRTPKSCAELAEKLWALRGTGDAGGVRLLAAMLLRSLAELPYQPETPVWFTRGQIAIAKEGERLLTSDLAKRIPARELAARFGVSESSFKQYFRGVFGENISDYVRARRMALARELLREGKLKIADVAASCGYENQSKFAAVFKREEGLSPLEYRRRARLQAEQGLA